MILVILGGTCSGKTEFALTCEKYGFPKVITNTTRAKRIDDKDDSYHFLTKEEFFEKVDNGEMIEYAEYNGWKIFDYITYAIELIFIAIGLVTIF